MVCKGLQQNICFLQSPLYIIYGVAAKFAFYDYLIYLLKGFFVL